MRTRTALLLSAAATALLMACQTSETLWRRADAPPGRSPTGPDTQAWLEQDQAECRQEIAASRRSQPQQAQQSPVIINPYPPPQPAPGYYQPRNPYPTQEQQEAQRRGANNLAAFLFGGMAGDNALADCMASKGWQKVTDTNERPSSGSGAMYCPEPGKPCIPDRR